MNQQERDVQSNEENNYDGGGEISFKDVGQFLKKSLVRMLIYLLVAVVVVTAIALAFKFFAATDYSVNATIEFTYDGVSAGKNPDGSDFNKENVRSVAYVNNALTVSELDKKVVDAGYDIGSVRASISINGIMPTEYIQQYNELIAGGMSSADAYAQLAQMTFYPTQFVVSFRDYEKFGMKKADAIKFVDELIIAYTDGFKQKYSQAVVFSDTIFSYDSDLYDYLDYCNIYAANYASIDNYLNNMSSVSSAWVSTETGKSFSALKQEATFLETQLSTLSSFVKSQNISKDIENMKVAAKNEMDDLTKELKRVSDVIASVEEQLRTFPPSTVTQVPGVGDPIITVTYPEAYYALQNRLTQYYVDKAATEMQLSEKTELYNAIKDLTQNDISLSDVARADSILASLRTSSKLFIQEMNATSADYVKLNFPDNSLRTVSPSAYVSTSADFPAMLAYLIGIVAAIAVALIVTAIMSKRAQNRKAAAEKEQQSELQAKKE